MRRWAKAPSPAYRWTVRRMLSAAMATITSILALILIGGRLGEWLPALDFLNNFTPIWLIVGMLSGTVWLICRRARHWPLLVMTAMLVSGGAGILPEVIRSRGRPSALPHETPVLRIVQFNTWKGNATPLIVARWLLDQRADILFLDEVESDSPLLQVLAAAYPYKQTCGVEGRCSTLILARVKPLASGGLARDDPENRRGLSAAWMQLSTRCGPVTAIATHMSRPWPWSGAERDLRQLVAALGTFDRKRVILAGDFNLTPWTFRMRRQDAQLDLARATHALPSWPSPLGLYGLPLPPLLPLDHIYTGASWQVADVTRGPVIGSDHYPLSATIGERGCSDTKSDSRHVGM